jgi:hypothetical protein
MAVAFARVPLLNLTAGVVGGDRDGYNNLWGYYWLKTALFDLHRNPYYTDYIYYPTGTSLRFHTLNPFNGLVTMPLNVTLGYVPTLNLVFVVAPLLTALFAFLLIRDMVGDGPAAFVGAAVATYSDYHIAVFLAEGQSSYITLQFIPLYLFFLFRALHGRPDWRQGVLVGQDNRRGALYLALSVVTLVCITLTDWQYLMFVFFATLLYSLFLIFVRRPAVEKAHTFGKLAVIGGAYALIVTPVLLLPMIAEALASPWLNVSHQADLHSVDLGWLLNPGIGVHGLVILAVALIGLWSAVRAGRGSREIAMFWLLAITFFYLMSLGPSLLMNGKQTGLPLPYGALQSLPVLSSGRDPARFTLVATLGTGVLVAFGVRGLLDFSRNAGIARFRPWTSYPRLGTGVVACVILVAALSGTMPAAGRAKIDPPLWPPFYEQLAKDSRTYAILELPLFSDDGLGADHYQMYQALHNKARFSGRLARDRKLDNPNNFVKRSSLFRQLWMLDFPRSWTDLYYPPRDILSRTDYATQGLQILNYYNTRFIILYKAAISPENQARMEDVILQVLGKNSRPYYEDGVMRVYSVPGAPSAPASKPFTLDGGDGWYAVEVGKDGVPYRWVDTTPVVAKSGYVVTPTAQLYTMNLLKAPVPAVFSFTAYPYRQSRTLEVSLNGRVVTTVRLKPGDGPRRVSLDLNIPPGNNVIEFASPEPPLPVDNSRADARLLSFAVQQVSLVPRPK